jgi:hypothetical protein
MRRAARVLLMGKTRNRRLEFKLLNNAVSASKYTALIGRVINELERIRKEALVA